MYNSDEDTVSIAVHPELRRSLLSNPTQESFSSIIDYQLFAKSYPNLARDILCLLPAWEEQALEGNHVIAALIQYMLKQIPSFTINETFIQANLLRIRILASTPGIVAFPFLEVQENLVRFLKTADLLADLPEFEVVSFTKKEISPLSSDLTRFRLSPHSRRYIQNLFHPERREAILNVLAHITKNYPLLFTCRQAYALMLSLDNPEIWWNHPFCLRLIANRFWDYELMKINHA
ncbi:hypothetical protein Desor_0720 [Desulfosporosinus orientis DSM 765]|uniref:Uncharacterized protein n=1 Tax=Desulfosporosinus orientis (strain ATCC 19365 / DSM 765 / NCIMB 8382 / VKM B-1628 / Singapore I) TaxID=768706 RepID=G7W7Y3_DESOD|nr:hypothetical protein [Desulfosporosinus orientis]AET66409.1 hypothetical protein Desor_0720 [Desulfosporosinus orientis DSM 765]